MHFLPISRIDILHICSEVVCMQKKDEQNKFNFLVFVLHSLFGIGTLLILLFLFAVLISSELISANSMTLSACISVFFSSLTASIFSAVKFGKRLITALLQGLFFYLVIYLIGIIVFGRFLPDNVTLWIPISCFLGSLFGAVLSTFFRLRKQ